MKPDRELVVETLMQEHQTAHQRVFNQVKLYESTNIRILMLMGVLLYFGISGFGLLDDRYLFHITNIVFLVIIPFIATASVAITAANLVKIMVLGLFLKSVEDKVNRVLETEAVHFGFAKGQVLDWERWRLEDGYANRRNMMSELTFSAILVVTFFLTSVLAVVLRLQFLFEAAPEYAVFPLVVSCLIGVLFIATAIVSIFLVVSKRREVMIRAGIVPSPDPVPVVPGAAPPEPDGSAG